VSPDALLLGFVAGVTVTGLAVGLFAWLSFCSGRDSKALPYSDHLVHWKKANAK